MTTPTVRDALDVLTAELRLATILIILPFVFDLALIYLAWRWAPSLDGWHPFAWLAAWRHPASRYADRLNLRPARGARP